MRIPSIVALGALFFLTAACSSAPALPDLTSCLTNDDCPEAPKRTLRAGYQEPIYEIVQEPIYEERKVPIWGEKSVPVYQTRRTPVTLTVWDPCTGCTKELDLFDGEKEVQVGVDRVRACLGYRSERVQIGSCPKRVIVGWRPAVEAQACAPAR